jgi:hypothetical protein
MVTSGERTRPYKVGCAGAATQRLFLCGGCWGEAVARRSKELLDEATKVLGACILRGIMTRRWPQRRVLRAPGHEETLQRYTRRKRDKCRRYFSIKRV